MPAQRKEVKPEEPLFVDEEGSYVHEVEQAKYCGGVRRCTQVSSGEGGAGGNSPGNARSNSPSPGTSKNTTSSSGASPPSLPAGGAAGAASTAAGGNGDGNTATGVGASGGVNTDGVVLYRHGRGTYTCPSFIYQGEWEEDEMHGTGQLTFTVSGNTYTGTFSHGCFCGQGTYRWRDGAVYTGQWRANRMHGDGVYTDAQGHIWKGKYYNGTGPGLIRLYPALERTEGVAPAEATAA